ncbi:hypothetical protein QQG55_25700 [Brugia pahangi]
MLETLIDAANCVQYRFMLHAIYELTQPRGLKCSESVCVRHIAVPQLRCVDFQKLLNLIGQIAPFSCVEDDIYSLNLTI